MSSKLSILLSFAFIVLCSAFALAECAPPTQAGAVLCFPTANATVNTPFNIEGGATGKNDSPITAMVLYVDNQRKYEFTYTSHFVQTDFNGYYDGWHHAVLNAWDAQGNLYQASAYFNYLTGGNGNYNPSCSRPQTGIHLCLPLNNAWYPEIDMPVLATGSSVIKSMSIYVNGELRQSTNDNYIMGGMGMSPTNTPVTVKVTGTDGKGHKWSATASGMRQYYDGWCMKSCDPGITIQSPPPATDQSSPFTLSAQVQKNPKPITAMKLYLDNTQVGSSTGPTIYQTINAAHGTHLITVQAWDTTGMLYKTQQTVNVQ